MTDRIRCVCFDWGGVILRICRSWAEGCSRAGLPVHPAAVSDRASAARRDAAEAFQLGRISRDEFFDAVSLATGRAYSPADVQRIHDAWLIAEYEGVPELIAELGRVKGLTTALLSNTNEAHWDRQLPRNGRPGDFPAAHALHVRHASHLLRLAKPDPAIYAAFERETGFLPGEVLFFDDLGENVAAARARGWRAEQINHTGDTASQMRLLLARHGILWA